eukprot:CAMPEP_0203642242 /NCGR_PEP_ID=MMETSP0088-20131115/7605_1 /ASSEMBLY_ACC=CAM_ASM_001087 /TAXON_ID=426623 /ORGANISM="Chaetoceros affinis, Strain CCMP159" /LENGTH=292 /DNA_ID=CAMNT_0050497993 /DNA_START=189 /DNA_END=1067 /DNA_ORIENTATION=-
MTCTVDAFSLVRTPTIASASFRSAAMKILFSTSSDDDDKAENNEEGMSLAADFFKTIQSRNIQLDDDDLLDDDEDDEDDDEEETGGDDDVENVSDVTLSDNQVYSELNERVLETAGGFVDLVSKASDDDDDDDESDGKITKPKVYEPPKTIPDPALTAGEVVTTVLSALNHNDVPTADYGVQILFGYSSSGSAISQAIDVEGMTPAEYATFLKEEYEYAILFNHGEVMIEKGDYSFDRKKAFFTARLSSVLDPLDCTNVNFILSTDGQGEDDCWLIDSLLIRPEGMRRRRRR